MAVADGYRRELAAAGDRRGYLLAHANLPGPRGNLELAAVAAELCPSAELRAWAHLGPEEAPAGTAEEYLTFCGVLGLRRELVGGDRPRALAELGGHARDPRWRVREAVAMALQFWGLRDFDALAATMREWVYGSWLERRAAAAALCEPALLTGRARVEETLEVLEAATAAVHAASPGQRRSPGFKALRRGLGYCWSVAAAAAPDVGLPALERLVTRASETGDPDLRWIARENLRKRRLARVDAAWVDDRLARL